MRAIYLTIFFALVLSGCGTEPNKVSNSATANTSQSASNSASQTNGAQTVTINSPDGVKLVGTFLDAGKPHSPALLLLHQWQSDRHSYDDFAKRMNDRGFNVLAIDGRGFGESTKKADGSVVNAGRSDDDVKAMLGDVGAG